jgi:O-antigen ligase
MGTSRSEATPASFVVCASAAVIPLSYAPVFDEPFQTTKLALGAALSAVAVAVCLRAGGLDSLRSALDLPLVAFGAAVLASALFSVDSHLSWWGPSGAVLVSTAGALACVAAFYAGRASAALDETLPERLARWTAYGAVPVCAVAVAEYLGAPLTPFSRGEGARAVSTLGHPTWLAAYAAFALPFAIGESFARSGSGKFLALSASVLCVLALWAARSRAGWIGAAGGAAAFYWLRAPRTNGQWRKAALAAAAAAGIALSTALVAGFFERSGDFARIAAWRISVEQFLETPWLGSGPGTYSLAFRGRESEQLAAVLKGVVAFPHAHNDWFEMLSSLGIAGIAVWAWLHWGAFRAFAGRLAGEGAERGAVAAAAGGLCALLILMKFNFPGFAAAWLAAAWAGVVCRSREEEPTLPLRSAGAVLAGGACAASLLLSFRQAAAERHDRLGGIARSEGRARDAVGRFERAVAALPGRVKYRRDLLNTIWDAAAERPEALAAAAARAAEGVRRRPFEPEMHRMLGVAEMKRGHLPRARSALESAVSLSPGMAHGLEDLIEVVRRQGDAARLRELENRLERISGRK